MQKIELSLEGLLETIEAFYDAKVWHFLTLNGIDLGDGSVELQWIFSKYGSIDEVVIYYCISTYDALVPSIVSIIPSAIMGEREVVDMFGIVIEGAAKGLYLDKDSKSMPLRCQI